MLVLGRTPSSVQVLCGDSRLRLSREPSERVVCLRLESLLSRSRRQQPSRVPAVHALENLITETQPVQRPVIPELFGLVEMLVLRFENAEGDAIHLRVESHVGAVNQAVRILRVELRGET